MAPKIDPSVLKALSLDAATTSIASHGGSGFSSTYKLTSTMGSGKKVYFVKTGNNKDSEVMFAGEHASLNAIHVAVPTLCPRSYAHGSLSETAGYFLVTSFLDLGSSSSSSNAKTGTGMSLAQKLTKLHSKPAPIPEGYGSPQFGFPVPTCCGDTVQDNSYKSSWAEFYAENRLRAVLRAGEKKHGVDSVLRELVDRTASELVPRLLRDGHLKSANGGGDVKPVVVHGDLWSGNHGLGRTGDGDGGLEEVVFDAAASWSHSEFEFGIMRMFGGFGGVFEREYERFKKRDEPVEEWEDRVVLYELYHHLNHYAIFGGSYKCGAVRIMETLLKKYGSE